MTTATLPKPDLMPIYEIASQLDSQLVTRSDLAGLIHTRDDCRMPTANDVADTYIKALEDRDILWPMAGPEPKNYMLNRFELERRIGAEELRQLRISRSYEDQQN